MSGNVAVVLIYEPKCTSKAGSVPLARVSSTSVAALVARAAIAEVAIRAAHLSQKDEFLGEVEQAEASKLGHLLGLLIPGLNADQTVQ